MDDQRTIIPDLNEAWTDTDTLAYGQSINSKIQILTFATNFIWTTYVQDRDMALVF